MTFIFTHPVSITHPTPTGRFEEDLIGHDFVLLVGGDGLNMYPQVEGGFGSMRVRSRCTKWAKRLK